MRVIRGYENVPAEAQGAVLAVGNFDGVHRGHRKMLGDLVARARDLDAPSVVVTFDPHPLKILHPEIAPKMLQTLRQREEAIEACGVDAIVLVPFTRDFSLTPAGDFVTDLLVKRLAAQGVSVVMISDEIPEVLYHSHRVLIMRNGRLTGEYRSHLSSEQELREAVNA